MERVKLTEFDWIDDLAELERWEDADRKTWRRVANLFDDWMVTLEEAPRRVTAMRADTTLSEDVRPVDERPVLSALGRLSERLDRPSA